MDIPPLPLIDCPPDDSVGAVSISLPADAPLITTGAVNTDCRTDGGVVTSRASVANANLLDQVTATSVGAECTANGAPTGSSAIADLVVAGTPTTVTGAPNQVVSVPGATITINRQTTTTNPDGSTTVTVDGLVASLAVGALTADAVLSSVS